MSSGSSFPEYYVLLGVPHSATTEEIRVAYKRESLRTHPDRLPNATSEEKKRATAKFQAVADAYYVLSDPVRRQEYDALLAARSFQDRTSDPSASDNFFSHFAQFFSSAASGGAQRTTKPEEGESTPEGKQESQRAQAFAEGRPDAEGVFGNVFEEMLRPEVEKVVPVWTYVGALSGASLGFIIANIPGMLMGGYAGNRLGAIRDAKGMSVAAVFAELGADKKAEILRALAFKVLGSI